MSLLQRISVGPTSTARCTDIQRRCHVQSDRAYSKCSSAVSLQLFRSAGRRSADKLLFRTRAAEGAEGPKASNEPDSPTNAPASSQTSSSPDSSNLVASIGIGVAYLCLIGYVVFLSPNQTPARDSYFLQKALSLISDSYTLPTVWTSLWYGMGVYPALYASLIVPTGRSSNKVPAWPFLAASFAFGAFALLPYFILWRPVTPPPAPSEEQSVTKTLTSTVIPISLVAAAAYCWTTALAAGPSAWVEFLRLFDESRFTHIMSIDFCTLTVLLPFWMWNDAEVRGWEPRDKVLPVLSLIPLLGPAIYLVLRPKNY